MVERFGHPVLTTMESSRLAAKFPATGMRHLLELRRAVLQGQIAERHRQARAACRARRARFRWQMTAEWQHTGSGETGKAVFPAGCVGRALNQISESVLRAGR